jgi:DNA-binding MarR family transcriptional regulator
MPSEHKDTESIAELICELTRSCTIKEGYFSTSFNLSPTEVRVLKLFISSPALPIKELCSKLRLSPGRVTQILKSLESKKLVIRSTDSKDKRNITVSIMPKGLPFINNLHRSYNELNARILGKVSVRKQKEILSSLDILVGVFRTWVAEDKV